MKRRYFRFIEIDKPTLSSFLNSHPNMKKFIDVEKPFYVRIDLKPYPSLISHVIYDNIDSANATAIAKRLEEATGKISARWVNKLTDSELIAITGNQQKADLIRNITNAVVSRRLNLKKLAKQDTQTIINTLTTLNISLSAAKEFALFGCFKQDVLCDTDPNFIAGLKIYLNKKDIVKQDIINITSEYDQQLTLFSLCMWRIVNERK